MQLFLDYEETTRRESWTAEAFEVLEQLAKSGREFTSDDLYAAGLGPAPHPNMVGPVFRRACDLGLIVPTRQVRRSQRRARKHGWVAEYRGAHHMTTAGAA